MFNCIIEQRFFKSITSHNFSQGHWFGGGFLKLGISQNHTSDILLHFLFIFSKSGERI